MGNIYRNLNFSVRVRAYEKRVTGMQPLACGGGQIEEELSVASSI